MQIYLQNIHSHPAPAAGMFKFWVVNFRSGIAARDYWEFAHTRMHSTNTISPDSNFHAIFCDGAQITCTVALAYLSVRPNTRCLLASIKSNASSNRSSFGALLYVNRL